MKKILNDLTLRFGDPNWALDPELALIDTILERHPELFEIVKGDIVGIGKDSRNRTARQPDIGAGSKGSTL